MSPKATIKWIPTSKTYGRHTGGLAVDLPPETRTLAFLEIYGGREGRQKLGALIGCDECPMFDKFPGWAEERIGPQIGQRDEEGTLPSQLPRVGVFCEGTDKMAKGEGICAEKFKKGKKVSIELG